MLVQHVHLFIYFIYFFPWLCQEEEQRRAKEEQERKEEEEYQKLKASFVVEEQGEAEELTEQEVTTLIFSSALTHRFHTHYNTFLKTCKLLFFFTKIII